MVEYLVLVGVIGIVALTAFKALGGKVSEKVQGATSTLQSQVNTGRLPAYAGGGGSTPGGGGTTPVTPSR